MYQIDLEHTCGNSLEAAGALLTAIPGMIDDPGIQIEIEQILNQFPDDLKKALMTPAGEAMDEAGASDTRAKVLMKYPKAYRQLLRKMFKEADFQNQFMLSRITNILRTGDDLVKAVPTRHGKKGLEKFWMPFDISALKKIRDVIIEHTEAFFYKMLNKKPVEKKLQNLVKKGIIKDPKEVTDVIKDAYVLSRAVDAMDRGVDLRNAMQIAAKRPLSDAEKRGIEWAREHTAIHMRGLANDLEKNIQQIVANRGLQGNLAEVESEKLAKEFETQRMRDIAREAARAKIAGQDWRAFSSHLKHHWGDYSRDWDRVAFTEFSYIENMGRALDYKDKYGPEVLVMKVPNPGACKICKLLYTTDGTTPRVFTVQELLDYGSNGDKWYNPQKKQWENRRASRISFNRKTGEFSRDTGGMVPTVGPIHPWCRCILMRKSQMVHKERLEVVENIKKEHPELEGIMKKIQENLAKTTLIKKGVLSLECRGGLFHA